MPDAEGESAEREWSCGMGDGRQDESEAASRPGHVGLDAPRQTCAVTAFCFATLQPRDGQAAVAVQVAAEQFERVAGDGRMAREVLRDRVLIEDNRHDRFGRLVRHSLALAVCGQLPEVLLELLRGQLALTVAGKDRLHAQIRTQDNATVRTTILDDVVV